MKKEKIIRKSIQGKGEVDYDFKHDILFFKTKDRNNTVNYYKQQAEYMKQDSHC